MTQRNLLRTQLTDAWKETIDIYQKQLINSEHGLQVYFCSALLRAFEKNKVKRRIFVEPKVSATNISESRYPDVVICNTKRVIGVVELKYAPRAVAKYKKDLKTFKFVASLSDDLTISNDRFLGITTDNRKYPLAPDVILCWAGVYCGPAMDLRDEIHPPLGARLLQLDAITAQNEIPTIYIDRKKQPISTSF